MKITFKGKTIRVQLCVFDITNTYPDRKVMFSVLSLPASANPNTAFITGNIYYHDENFSEAWNIVCKLLGEKVIIPKRLEKYNIQRSVI